MGTTIETVIDDQPFVWHAAGTFAWGVGGPLCQVADDPLLPGLGPAGYRVVDLPAGCAEATAAAVAALLAREGVSSPHSYHRTVDERRHLQIITKTRELHFRDLDSDPESFTRPFGAALGVQLSKFVPMLGGDHIQLRINRPGSTDYNPPHRDGSLAVWQKTLNVWIPVAGVDASTSLPVVPASHEIAESECWQTEPGGAAIAERRYRVPAIARLRRGALRMTRPPIAFGQALLFTPFLIHGLAVNQAHDRTRMALELRLQVVDDRH